MVVNRKKKKRNSLARFAVAVIFIILIGFFIFYAIDNPGFLSGLFDREKDGAQDTVQTEVQMQETPVSVNGTEPGDPSSWQRIIGFFKSKFDPPQEVESYPSRLTIEIYFARTGEEKILASEERTIVAGNPDNALKSAMEELLEGPAASYHFPVIPAGTKLAGSRVA